MAWAAGKRWMERPASICFSGACWPSWFHWGCMSNSGRYGSVFSGVGADCTINSMAASYRGLGIAFNILIWMKEVTDGDTCANSLSPLFCLWGSGSAFSHPLCPIRSLSVLWSWRGGRHVRRHLKPISGKLKRTINVGFMQVRIGAGTLLENVDVLQLFHSCADRIVYGKLLGPNVLICSCAVIWYI